MLMTLQCYHIMYKDTLYSCVLPVIWQQSGTIYGCNDQVSLNLWPNIVDFTIVIMEPSTFYY